MLLMRNMRRADSEDAARPQEMMSARDWGRLWRRDPHCFGVDGHHDAPSRRLYHRSIARLLKGVDLRGGSILELGCGTGLVSVGLYDRYRCRRALLIDFSPEAVAIARVNARGRNIEIRQENVLDWSASATFDLVMSVGLVEHFARDTRQRIVDRHAALVRPGGHVLILAPRPSRLGALLQFFNRAQGICEVPCDDVELVAACNRSGLSVLRRARFLVGTVAGVLAQKRIP